MKISIFLPNVETKTSTKRAKLCSNPVNENFLDAKSKIRKFNKMGELKELTESHHETISINRSLHDLKK